MFSVRTFFWNIQISVILWYQNDLDDSNSKNKKKLLSTNYIIDFQRVQCYLFVMTFHSILIKVFVFPVNNNADDWSTDRLYCKSAYFTYGDKVYIAKQIITINE